MSSSSQVARSTVSPISRETGIIEYRPYPPLSSDFVALRIRPGWKDLAWAAKNHWLGAGALSAFAEELAGADDDARVEIAMAQLEHDELRLRSLLEAQASSDETPDGVVTEHWLDVALAWLYENRRMFDDPLRVVEEIWEAFGHPESANTLIRWMPLVPGQAAGDQAIMERWRAKVAGGGSGPASA